MKKVFFTIVLSFLFVSAMQAQGDFKVGVTGGLINSNTNINISALGFSLVDIDAINSTGFYVGGIADVGLSDKFHAQAELTYGSAGNLGFVYLPVLAKYYVASGFNLQAGPQFSFSTTLDAIKDGIEDIEDVIGTNGNIDDVVSSTGVDFALGAGFDITENLSVQGRYAFELTNRYNGPLNNTLTVRASTFNIGVAYFF